MHQIENKMPQNESKMHQRKGKMPQNESKLHQSKGKMEIQFSKTSIFILYFFFCQFVSSTHVGPLLLNVTENGFQGCNLFQIT